MITITLQFDDMVDAATLFGRMLAMIIAGRNPKKPTSPHGVTLDDLWCEHDAAAVRRERDQ